MENKILQIAFLTIIVLFSVILIIYTTIKLFERFFWKNIKQEDKQNTAYLICLTGLILSAGMLSGVLGKVLVNLGKVIKLNLADFDSLSIFLRHLGLFLFLEILILLPIFLSSYLILLAIAKSRKVLMTMIEENNNYYAICFATVSFILVLSIIDNVILLFDYFIPYPSIPAFK